MEPFGTQWQSLINSPVKAREVSTKFNLFFGYLYKRLVDNEYLGHSDVVISIILDEIRILALPDNDVLY